MTVHDPVCGMEIEPQSAFAKREHMGQTFYFCSQSCVDQFDKDPHRYVMTSATTGFNPERTLTRIELPVSGLPLKEHADSPGGNSACREWCGCGKCQRSCKQA